MREVLPRLNVRSKWFENADLLNVGDVVIVCDEDMSYRDWHKGVVVEIFKATDDQVRGAIVRSNGKLVKRPASKLAKLEIGNSLDVK